jgi:hypothetical protein
MMWREQRLARRRRLDNDELIFAMRHAPEPRNGQKTLLTIRRTTADISATRGIPRGRTLRTNFVTSIASPASLKQ